MINWRALIVEVIRRLWDRGILWDHPVLLRVHDHWFDLWVDWRAEITMQDVDQQAEALVEQWDAEDPAPSPVFSEVLEGETALGGEMRLHYEDLID